MILNPYKVEITKNLRETLHVDLKQFLCSDGRYIATIYFAGCDAHHNSQAICGKSTSFLHFVSIISTESLIDYHDFAD